MGRGGEKDKGNEDEGWRRSRGDTGANHDSINQTKVSKQVV